MTPNEPTDDDDAFRRIVAGYDTDASDPVPRWPVSEDAGPDDPKATQAVDAPPPTPDVDGALQADNLDALPGWLEPEALKDEGRYVPPPPPGFPWPRLRTAAGLVILLLGLATLLVPGRLGLDNSPGSLLFGMLVTTAGSMVLLNALRDGPGPDDDPDDGAVV